MNVPLTRSLLCLLLLGGATARAWSQNVFPEIYKGCNTDQFALERDTTTAKHDAVAFTQLLRQELGPKRMERLRGELKLQIIVQEDGSSCLLSIENKTNMRSKQLDLKRIVDQRVKWAPLSEKVAALIVLDFTDVGLRYRRLGMDGKKGWHYLEH